jgi:hypothetical protein
VYIVREAAAKNINCTKENLDKAFGDIQPGVVKAAAGNPNCTKEHIDKALDDEDDDVIREAKQNPRYKEYYPTGDQK